MSASTARIGAVIRKELAEFRRNRLIITTAGVLPVVKAYRGRYPWLSAAAVKKIRPSPPSGVNSTWFTPAFLNWRTAEANCELVPPACWKPN